MRKIQQTSHELIERLEKKYQKKLRIQKYKSINRDIRQLLTGTSGTSVDDIDEISPELQDIGGYEYLSR